MLGVTTEEKPTEASIRAVEESALCQRVESMRDSYNLSNREAEVLPMLIKE